MGRVKLQDVAAAAGVSVATVSHALNGNGTVSDRTARRVRQVAVRLGYRPDAVASNLRRQRTSTIGVLIPSLLNPFYSELVEHLETAALKEGYSLLGGTTHFQVSREDHYVDLFLRQKCAGIVVISQGGRAQEVAAAHVPVVIVNVQEWSPESGVWAAVEVDDGAGVRDAVDHLIRLGHRRLGLVAIPSTPLREVGYRDALREAGIEYDPALVVRLGRISRLVEDGRELVSGLLARHPDVTALMVLSDMVAFGAIRAAVAAGRRVPDDLAVVGFDGIGLGAATVPALTTVEQPIAAVAGHAIRLFVEVLDTTSAGNQHEYRRVRLAPRLVVRESCGAGVAGQGSEERGSA
jgi:LacI family transcriptional regulator